jgi:hypothetical protein
VEEVKEVKEMEEVACVASRDPLGVLQKESGFARK